MRQQQREQFARIQMRQQEEEFKRREEAERRRAESEEGEGSARWEEGQEQEGRTEVARNSSSNSSERSWLNEGDERQQDGPRNLVRRKPERGFWHAIKRALGLA